MTRRDEFRRDYLTRREAAEYAGVSEQTIKRLAQQGQLKRYHQLGERKVLFLREELDRVIRPQPVSA